MKKESVCTVVDVDLMNKVRAIAKKEDLSITTIFEVGLKMAIQNYEAKNGPIRVRQSKKKDVGDVFGFGVRLQPEHKLCSPCPFAVIVAG